MARMLSSSGRKVTIYIPGKALKFYDDLVQANDDNASEAIRKAVYDANLQQRVGVKISEGAYLCLAAGRFDLLNCVKLEEGITIITMKEDAYKLKDGVRGEFADAKDALFDYLDK